MPKLSREYLIAAALAGIVAVLALLMALEWMVLNKRREQTLALPPAQASASALGESGEAKEFELPALDDYRQMAERPLFMETRRPGAEPTEAAAPPPPPMLPMTLKLMGIVFSPQGKKALVMDAKGKYHRIAVQQSQDSWTLVEIGESQVIMQQGESREKLPLLKKKPKTPGPPLAQAGLPGQPIQAGQPPRPGRPPIPPRPQAIEEESSEPQEDIPEEEDTGSAEEDTDTGE